ncbi:NnrU family protein [Henriciella mobilis]|uniref:NnrU family protein n=1 Tax=Henriciella mobilis TaxID=2305467 RepID=A0A399R899_9PROT|nr:NnrU family protein [Henriciella mobilis]RIJ15688.1 NnrU family protein [Henriciella mobilis]RIJ19152.1 NnrU family protein [Henriciella mobilis]RIJ27856.1 NnrU family protein [Henriciella mobilis]
MTYLLAGLVLFFGPHLFSAFRSRAPGSDLRTKMGYGPYMGLYSLLTIAGFVLIIYGYGAMRPSAVIWVPPVWLKHVNMLFQLLALPILVAAYMPAGHIKKTLKHPMLVAVKLWALGHLLANGELNSIILFGSFLAYGVIDRIAVKKRGDNGPPADLKPNVMGDVLSVVVGLGVYAAIAFWLHPILFGVPAMPA